VRRSFAPCSLICFFSWPSQRYVPRRLNATLCHMIPHAPSNVEFRDVAPGLWIWRVEHPRWKPGQGWDPVVTSTCVESGGERLLLDPIAPPPGETGLWERLDAHPPTGLEAGSRFPGRIVALYDGRGRNETPVWLPDSSSPPGPDSAPAHGERLSTRPEGSLLA
jgi:hypothetical protein